MTQDKFNAQYLAVFAKLSTGSPRNRALAFGCLEHLEAKFPAFVSGALSHVESEVSALAEAI